MDCQDARALIPDAPASAQTVLCALVDQGPLTMQGLQQASGLARRTVYGAVCRLRELGMIIERANLRDTRQKWYWAAS